jgi:hypothetical protein
MSDVTGPAPVLPPPSGGTRPDQSRVADRRWPILLVVIIALLVAVVVDRVTDEARSSATELVAGPAIPAVDSVSSAWYCALGSSAPGGTPRETVVVTNIGNRAARASVTVMPGGGGDSVTRDFDVATRSQVRVAVSEVLATAEPGVVVETFGGLVVVEHQVVGSDDVAIGPCATGPASSWHFAAGTTERGTQLWLALFNPFGDDAIVDLDFLTDSGFLAPGDLQGLVVPRRTRVLVPVHDTVRRQASVATQVRTRTGRVVAEQASVREADPKGLAVSLGTPELASRWSFPAGAVGGADVVVVANPGASPARVTVSVRLDGDATLAPQVVVVPSRATVAVDVGTRVPAGLGAWVEVDAHGARVVAEQTVTRPPIGLATSLGVESPARRWAFATGRTARESADVVVVTNPGRSPARVTLHLLRAGTDDSPVPAVRLAPGRRTVFDLTALDVGASAGIVVDATEPVAAARQNAGTAGVTVSPGIPGAARASGGS